MASPKYRYEIHCYSPSLGEMYDEKSGWYDDLSKCSDYCIARVNGKKFREELIENDCPYECNIEIYIVSDTPSVEPQRTFSRYNVIKKISDMIDPTGYNDTYEFP